MLAAVRNKGRKDLNFKKPEAKKKFDFQEIKSEFDCMKDCLPNKLAKREWPQTKIVACLNKASCPDKMPQGMKGQYVICRQALNEQPVQIQLPKK